MKSFARFDFSLLQKFSLHALAVLLTIFALPVLAQTQRAVPTIRITEKVDNAKRTTLTGNTHPYTKRLPDLGAVDPSSPMNRMLLSLTRSDEQDAALVSLMDAQQDKNSPNFHQWLTPADFGTQFGASDADIKTVTDWLKSQGFTVNSISNGRNMIDFSGSAAQVVAAFQTSIHKFSFKGGVYQANTSDPTIPSALAPVVRGIVSLHNFPRDMHHVNVGSFQKNNKTGVLKKIADSSAKTGVSANNAKPNFTFPDPTYAQTDYGVSPYDFATIYNLKPLWAAGIDGTGQSIAVLEETNIHLDDVRAFRSIFGLPANDPVIILNGTDPGITSTDEEGEATLDAQWAGAVAKAATIKFILSASTATTSGIDLSALYAIDNNVAPVTSLSYGYCELLNLTAGNAYYNALWQQGAAQGISHMVSTGDSGSASCDQNSGAAAADGLQVSGFASTPYNTAVGGTDFLGTPISPATYWGANDPTTKASALSYIPETTWNSGCTLPLFQTGIFGSYGTTSAAVCQAQYLAGSTSYEAVGGSGGASTCTTSTGTTSSCSGGYAKPSWQTGVGVPADSHRDLPDVSLFAASGYLGSFYVYCQEDLLSDGNSCNANSPYSDIEGVGGTSVSTPAFAGIMALVNQKTNSRQGVANYVLYSLFNQQTTAGTSCGASGTFAAGTVPTAASLATPAAGCVFNDITYGSNSSACTSGSKNCTKLTGNHYGVLTAASPEVVGDGYLNTVGYDLATGLGSVNATNLINSWNNVSFTPTTTTLGLASTTFAHGTSVNATITVAPTSGGTAKPTGLVQVDAATTPSALGPATLASGTVTVAYNNFPGGTYNVTAYYAGDGTYASSTSAPVSITVTPENSTLTETVGYISQSTYAFVSSTAASYGAQIAVTNTVAGTSGHGIATGSVSLKNSNATYATVPINTAGAASFLTASLAPASYSFSGSYAGDASFNSSTSAAKAMTVSQGTTVNQLSASASTINAGATVTLTALLYCHNSQANGSLGAAFPSGTISFYSGGTTLLGTVPFTSFGYVSYYTTDDSISSEAVLTTSNLPFSTTATLSDSITAVYNGDTNYKAATSTATTVKVNKGTLVLPTETVTSSAGTSFAYGLPTTVTAALTSGSGTPTGTVTFYLDGNVSGSAVTLSSGSATYAVSSSLSAGKHTVVAVYSGSATFQGTTGSVNLTVGIASTTLAVTASSTTALQGTPLTFTGTITKTGAATPTGTMTFTIDGGVFGVGGSGVGSIYTGGAGASINISSLTPGSHTIAASYSGDSNYSSSTATGVTVIVTAAPQLILSITQRGTIVLGAPVAIAVQAQSINGGTIPTGSVTYTVDGGAASSPVALTVGAALFAVSGLNVQKHTIVVTYSGDSTYTTVNQALYLNGDVAQTILFPGLSSATLAVTPTIYLAVRSTSGLPVSYSVSGPATLSGSVLTLTGKGTVSVTASQSGSTSFGAATSVTRSFVVQ